MKKGVYIFSSIYIIILAIPVAIYLKDNLSFGYDSKMLVSGVLGLLAYTILAFQFFIASRPKFVDRLVSLDRLYRFHMMMAVAALLMAYIHKTLKEMYFDESTQTNYGDYSFDIFLAISLFSIVFMVNKLFLRTKLTDKIRSYINKTIKLKYGLKRFIHNLTIIGLILLLIHVLLAGSVSYSTPIKVVTIGYFVIPLLLYANLKIAKPYLYKKNRYIVNEVIKESSNMTTVRFKPTNGKVVKYLPGQFLYTRIFSKNTSHDEHPFTISSSPTEDGIIGITVKNLGDFTKDIDKVQIGDKTYIDGGFGGFSYLRNVGSKKLCFIAGGVGITPFLSMLKYMADKDWDREVVLLYGAVNKEDLIKMEELTQYAKQIKNLLIVPVLSEDEAFDGEKGFITPNIISKYTKDPLAYDFYICGPPVMLDAQLANLKSLGVHKSSRHFERFAY